MSSPNEGNPKEEEEEEEDASDVELEGIDMEGIDEEQEVDDDEDDTMEDAPAALEKEDEAEVSARQKDDAEELEAAKRERMELLAAEQKEAAKQMESDVQDPQARFAYLLSQSEVFGHFLAGSVAASAKKNKKGSRGKTGRLTEAEEDEQMLKSAQSKRRTIRLDKQPGNIGKGYNLHKYQLEGLNWMIKLHDSGINGILADEVSVAMAAKGALRDFS